MARIKIQQPSSYSFTCEIPVRITDLNYGGHVGNDSILGIIHEARMKFLHTNGYSELNFDGAGMIMADAGIEFKSELFYGETVIAQVAVTEITNISFDLVYRLEKNISGKLILVALGKTGMISYDYEKRKITAIPVRPKEWLQRMSAIN